MELAEWGRRGRTTHRNGKSSSLSEAEKCGCFSLKNWIFLHNSCKINLKRFSNVVKSEIVNILPISEDCFSQKMLSDACASQKTVIWQITKIFEQTFHKSFRSFFLCLQFLINSHQTKMGLFCWTHESKKRL